MLKKELVYNKLYIRRKISTSARMILTLLSILSSRNCYIWLYLL